MELTIKRNAKIFKGVRFHFSTSESIDAKYNITGGLWLRKITLRNEQGVIYVMKQKSIFKKLLSLPLQFIISPSFPDFYIYQEGQLIGKSFYKFSSEPNKIKINNDIYETQLHSKNYMSIFKNGIQVALLQRGETIILGSVDYKVFCDKAFFQNKELLVLLTAFLDILYWRPTWSFAIVQKRVTIGKEDFPEMISWRPIE